MERKYNVQTFTDAEGREWFLEFNISSVRRYRLDMAKDLKLKEFDFLDYAGILAALNDVFFAADLLYLVCREQAEERGLVAEEFGRALKGKILFDAIAAFVAEYLDFFPDPTTAQKMREVVAATHEKQNALRDLVVKTWTEKVDEALENVTEKLAKESV